MIRRTLLILILVILSTVTIGCAQAKNETPPAASDPGIRQYRWPMKLLTNAQIQEMQACDIKALYEERNVPVNPKTACDWAVQIYDFHQGDVAEQIKGSEIKALNQLIQLNYGYLLSPILFYTYYYSPMVVSPAPSFANQVITKLRIEYESDDMADVGRFETVGFVLVINNAHKQPEVKVEYTTPLTMAESVNVKVPADLLQAIGPTLYNLLPIGRPTRIDRCWDHYPDWTVVITFQDNTEVEFKTIHSTFDLRGGPFQAEINGRYYLVYNEKLTSQLVELVRYMNLQLGAPIAMGCGGYAGGAEDLFALPSD